MDSEQKTLYPLSFEPAAGELGDTWLLADLGWRDSAVTRGWLEGNTLGEIMETFMERVIGDNAFYFFGRQFPLSVRRLSGRTPLWVCPDDAFAAERYDALGRKKWWYVLRAGKGARVYAGLRRDITATEFYEASFRQEVPDFMRVYEPAAGESFLLEPGILHGADGDIEVLEIAESSPLDCQVCTWNGMPAEEFGAVEAMEFARLTAGEPVRGALPCSCDEFDIARIDLHDPVRVEGDEQFSVLVCLSGKASVQTGTSSKGANASSEEGSGAGRYPVAAGGVLLIPAELNTYFLVPEAADTVLLEASVRRVPEIAKDPTTLWQTPSE